MWSTSLVMFELELEVLSLKIKAQPAEPPPTHSDREVHASAAAGVSAEPGFPALGVATALFMLSCCCGFWFANRQSSPNKHFFFLDCLAIPSQCADYC